MLPARSPHRAEVPPVATAGAEDAGVIAGVVAVALPPGDALAAVKENLPLTG